MPFSTDFRADFGAELGIISQKSLHIILIVNVVNKPNELNPFIIINLSFFINLEIPEGRADKVPCQNVISVKNTCA